MKRLNPDDTSILALMAELAENNGLDLKAANLLTQRLKTSRGRRVGLVIKDKSPKADPEVRKVAAYFKSWAKANNTVQHNGKKTGPLA